MTFFWAQVWGWIHPFPNISRVSPHANLEGKEVACMHNQRVSFRSQPRSKEAMEERDPRAIEDPYIGCMHDLRAKVTDPSLTLLRRQIGPVTQSQLSNCSCTFVKFAFAFLFFFF